MIGGGRWISSETYQAYDEQVDMRKVSCSWIRSVFWRVVAFEQ